MQCKLEQHLPEGPNWEYEAKLDGYRALVVKREGRVTLLSRRNNILTQEFPEIAAALQGLDDETVSDGEIVALDKNGKPAFNRLQNRRFNRDAVLFYAFDLPVFRGKQLTREPLKRLRELLNLALATIQDPVRASTPLRANADALLKAAREHNLEGIIAKRQDSRYEPGKRTRSWVKVKINLDQELVIGGYIPAAKPPRSSPSATSAAQSACEVPERSISICPSLRNSRYTSVSAASSAPKPSTRSSAPKHIAFR
jgi:ATP-dependent DNA ligase